LSAASARTNSQTLAQQEASNQATLVTIRKSAASILREWAAIGTIRTDERV